MVNNVIGVVSYVIAARPSLRNFMTADTGSLRTLRRHTAGLCQETTPARPPAPASRKVATWILTPPGNLTGRRPRRPLRGTRRHPRPGPRLRQHAPAPQGQRAPRMD